MPKQDKAMSLVREAADDLVNRVTEIVSSYCRKYTATMDIWSDKLGYNSCLGKNVEDQFNWSLIIFVLKVSQFTLSTLARRG